MNQRPLPFMLAGFVLGEVWIWQLQRTAALAALIFAVFLLIVGNTVSKGSFFRCWKRMIYFFSFGLLLGGLRESGWLEEKEDFSSLKSEDRIEIEGQIEEKKEGEEKIQIVLNHLVRIPEKGKPVKKNGKVLLYVSEKGIYGIGHRLHFSGQIEDFDLPTNPGQFDQRKYQESRGIFGCCYEPSLLEERYGSFLIGDGLEQIRKKMKRIYQVFLTERQEGPAIAMVLGDKTSLSKDQKDNYQYGGISHILAVSGLHMTLFGMGMYRLLRRLGFGYGISVFSNFPLIGAYTLLTGMSSSCLRAMMMLMIYLFGEWKGLSYDLFSSLSFAGLLLLLEIPARLFDSGFLLSFGAVFGAGIYCPLVLKYLGFSDFGKKNQNFNRLSFFRHKIFCGFFTGICIFIITIPVSLSCFYGISMAGLFLNLLVIPLMSLLLFLLTTGGIFCLFSRFRFPGKGFLRAGGAILDFYEWICIHAKKCPGMYLVPGYRNIWFGIIYYILCFSLLFVLWSFFHRKKEQKIRVIILCLGWGMLFFLTGITGKKGSFLTVLDVGQGDGILFHSKKGEVCLIDGGSSSKKEIGAYIIKPALSYYGISYIDNWIVSHTDEDHISGLKELLEEEYPIGRLIFPITKEKNRQQMELELLARKNHTKIIYMQRKDCLKLKEGTFYCLHPAGKIAEDNPNENCLVFCLSLKKQAIFLTGDVEKGGEEILTDFLKSWKKREKETILKVSHHGSANGTGTNFLQRIKPDAALISCGRKNPYGHPSKEVLERLQEQETAIYRTDQSGAIEIRCQKKTFYFSYGDMSQVARPGKK